MRVVFMGTPEFAGHQLQHIHDSKHEIVGVVTVADKPAGRGKKIKESAVKKRANLLNLPIVQPTKLRDETFIKQLKDWNADVFVVVAFRMLPKVVWAIPEKGTFNLHASLLPQYRGAAPINWAIVNGEKKSGVTTFLIDEKIDTGGILLQKEVELTPKETAGSLHDKLMDLGAKLIIETVDGLEQGRLAPRSQKENTKTLHDAPKIFKGNSQIQPKWEINKIDAMVRGMNPYPTAWLEIIKDGEKLDCKILAGEVIAKEDEDLKEGISTHMGYINIVGRNTIYRITQIKAPGKKAMSSKDLLNGWGKNVKLTLTDSK